MKDSNITPFKHDCFGTIRVIIKEGAPWFVAKDVCDALGTAAKDIPAIMNEDERDNIDSIDSIGRSHKMTIISEPGLYSLVLRSRKPEAKEFKRWVTHEVLPSIRKTGSYSATPTLPDFTNPAVAARAWADLYEKNLVAQKALRTNRNAIEELLDTTMQAIAHQNEINDRRTATALGRNGGYVADRNRWKEVAAELTKEQEALKEQVGDSKHYKTVRAIKWLESAFNLQIKDKNGFYSAVGWCLARLTEKLKKDVRKIEDSTFGSVNAYHVDVIDYAREHLIEFCKTHKNNKYTARLISLKKKEFWKK